ncbi:MAG TPA: biotin/lipoyl-containing protein [Burkholderiaceae bacterium]|nr:biotin/lipoyl-containing protein [Burkholderiaceae bacterium]
MGLIIKMPLINVNDASAVLIRWLCPDGASVRKDDPVCVVETTKSAVDICADADGILRHLAAEGETCPTGHPIGFLAASVDEPVPVLEISELPPSEAAPRPEQASWTKKAMILANRLGIDLMALVAAHPGVVIGEELVQAAAASRTAMPASATIAAKSPGTCTATSWGTQERILILGGGGGASLVLDIFANSLTQHAVGILDNNPAMAGKLLMGVPILGGFDLALRLWQEKKFDALISTVVRDIADRASIFEHFTQLGIPFANVIAPSASIRSGASLGTGNLIVHGCYVATETTLGDNNFLAAGTYIEHHSAIGSHCTFGPRTSLSGKVKVGDRVKFGTHVAVEPYVEIGAESVIASGVVLTSHVPEYSIVKNAATLIVRNVK